MKKGTKNTQGARRRVDGKQLRSNELPQYSPQVQMSNYRMRFVALSSAVTTVLWSDLLDTIHIAKAANASTELFDAVRVREVSVMSSGTTLSGPTNGYTEASVTFAGYTLGQLGDEKTHTATSIGVEPLHLRARPSRNSQASQWQLSSNGVAFYMHVVVGAIIDVVVDFRMVDTLTPTATRSAGAGMTVGQVYYRGLDGLAAAASQFQPVGLVNIA